MNTNVDQNDQMDSFIYKNTRWVWKSDFTFWILCWFSLLSGVPQSSALGMLLFLIFDNDLVLWIRNRILLFADDTKPTFPQNLRWKRWSFAATRLDSLVEYTKKCCLQFNVEKCKLMRVAHWVGVMSWMGQLQEIGQI